MKHLKMFACAIGAGEKYTKFDTCSLWSDNKDGVRAIRSQKNDDYMIIATTFPQCLAILQPMSDNV